MSSMCVCCIYVFKCVITSFVVAISGREDQASLAEGLDAKEVC